MAAALASFGFPPLLPFPFWLFNALIFRSFPHTRKGEKKKKGISPLKFSGFARVGVYGQKGKRGEGKNGRDDRKGEKKGPPPPPPLHLCPVYLAVHTG